MVFTPDLEAEGSQNPELRNDQARNQALEFADGLSQVATSAEFAGGAVIKLQEATGNLAAKTQEYLDLGPAIAGMLTDFASNLGAAATGADNFGESILKSLGGFMESFGASLIALGIGKVALDAFSGPEMIAAGFALSAAGGALSAASAKVSSAANIGSAPGQAPTEVNINGRSYVQGYTIATVLDKDSYRRGRIG